MNNVTELRTFRVDCEGSLCGVYTIVREVGDEYDAHAYVLTHGWETIAPKHPRYKKTYCPACAEAWHKEHDAPCASG